MKIFLDTANINEIKEALEWGVIDGITTNPTILAKEKKDITMFLKELAGLQVEKVGNKEDIFEQFFGIRINEILFPISIECISTGKKSLIEEGREISKLNPNMNIVVKIQATEEGLKAINILSKENIRINATLIFSANQALLAAKAGASYISPFIGRLDDIGYDGMQVIRDIVQIFRNYNISTQVLVASVRDPIHVLEAGKAGAHIVTVPFNVLKKLIQHPLTDKGIEIFLDDWKKARRG